MGWLLLSLLIPAIRMPASCHMGLPMARSLRLRCAAVRLDESSELSLERVNPYVDTLLNSEWHAPASWPLALSLRPALSATPTVRLIPSCTLPGSLGARAHQELCRVSAAGRAAGGALDGHLSAGQPAAAHV